MAVTARLNLIERRVNRSMIRSPDSDARSNSIENTRYRKQPKVSQKNKEGAVSALRYRTRYLVFRPPRRAAARDNQRGHTCAELHDCRIAFR